jgi:hypothetical protein
MDIASIFDLDGTPVDSVFQHKSIIAGMSGGPFINMLQCEVGMKITPDSVDRLRHVHAKVYQRQAVQVHLLPEVRECPFERF